MRVKFSVLTKEVRGKMFIKKQDFEEVSSFSADYRENNYKIESKSKRDFKKKENSKIHTSEINKDVNFDNKNILQKKIIQKEQPKVDFYNRKTKKNLIIKSSIALLFSILGVIVLLNHLSLNTFNVTYEENYNDFLLPVVMNDPEPFELIDDLNLDTILNSAVWHTIISQDYNKYEKYDELGRTIIPFNDVSESASKLFGSLYNLPLENPSKITFFELDKENKNFLIKPISSDESYLPNIILQVGYSYASDPFWEDKTDVDINSYEKIMIYVLDNDIKNKSMYISKVQNDIS